MIKLSTKVRYGTRAMLDLACHYGDGPVLLKDVARRQGVSLKYLERILTSFKPMGLVKSLRGAKGGYSLSFHPSQINLKQVVEALDGEIRIVGCIKDKVYCQKVNSCVTHDIWEELSKAIEATLKSTTLEDLIIRSREKKKSPDNMYYI
ncbi:MAG: Rrf2 family transcriptional regulator [Candidatus Omnitrophota bacterium]